MLDLTEVIAFDWSTLKEECVELAVNFAKEEAGELASSTKDKIAKKWNSVDWFGSQKEYKLNLHETIRKTKVLGNPKSIEIDSIYTDCYVYDKLTALSYFSENTQSLERYDSTQAIKATRHSALEIALCGENLFILGRPGAGKTTFLKYLTILACTNKIDKTPIFVSVKEWSDSSLSIEKFITKQFDICGFPNADSFTAALLGKGNALILLDGLDEVNEEAGKRNQIIREVVSLSNKYRKCQVCLTCRTAGTDYSFEQFKYLEVADFTDEQKLHFIRLWYGNNSQQLDRFLTGWNDLSSAGIRDLGKTPLLITLLCLAFDETLQFPVRQVDLYKEAIDALLRKWDSSRLLSRDTFYKNLSFTRREHLLEYIAAHFYFNSQTVFQKSSVEKYISSFLKNLPDKEKSTDDDASFVLKQIEAQHGLLVERARNLFSFSHLTIQEYFTASYIVQSHDSKYLEQIVGIALKDQKWREVVLYTVALLPSADPVLGIMGAHLIKHREQSLGAQKFLAYCYCRAAANANPDHHIQGNLSSDIVVRLHQSLEAKNPLPLTHAEVTKIKEHLSKISAFLKLKGERYDFGNAAKIFTCAAEVISTNPSIAAKFLGGHRARPDEFISYLYACRLMIECLEVAMSASREAHLKSVLSIDNEDLLKTAGL